MSSGILAVDGQWFMRDPSGTWRLASMEFINGRSVFYEMCDGADFSAQSMLPEIVTKLVNEIERLREKSAEESISRIKEAVNVKS
jgi:hypothetical protein